MHRQNFVALARYIYSHFLSFVPSHRQIESQVIITSMIGSLSDFLSLKNHINQLRILQMHQHIVVKYHEIIHSKLTKHINMHIHHTRHKKSPEMIIFDHRRITLQFDLLASRRGHTERPLTRKQQPLISPLHACPDNPCNVPMLILFFHNTERPSHHLVTAQGYTMLTPH